MSGQVPALALAEHAAAGPCLEVLRLAAKLTLENRDGLARLLVALIDQQKFDEGVGSCEAVGMVEELGVALVEMVRDARQQHHGRLTAADTQELHQEHIDTERDGSSCKRPRMKYDDGSIDDHEHSSNIAPLVREVAAASSVCAPRDARSCVLGDADLVQHIMSMLAAPEKQARRDVGSMGSVCRLWRVVSRHDDVWRGTAAGLMPVVAAGVTGMGCWEYMREYGRGLVERPVWGEHDWEERLSLHVDLWDEMDGLRMLSAYGQVKCMSQEDDSSCLGIDRVRRHEVLGRAFSAVSRDPVMGRLADIREHFERCRLPEYPSRLRIRAAVVDNASGRTAVIVDRREALNACTCREVPELAGRVAPGTLVIHAESVVILRAASGPSVSASWAAFISPVPGQADVVTEGEKLWRMAMTPADTASLVQILFDDSVDDVKAFLFSALAQ